LNSSVLLQPVSAAVTSARKSPSRHLSAASPRRPTGTEVGRHRLPEKPEPVAKHRRSRIAFPDRRGYALRPTELSADARDADGLSVFSFTQAQGRARDWFRIKTAEQAGDFVPLDQPYTVTDAVTDYLAGYKRRSGKAIDRVEAVVRAWIEP
jgi:hypothetical protein